MEIRPGGAPGANPPMRPGPGRSFVPRERLRLFTNGQPQMYAMRPTAETYSGVMTVPGGVPNISAGLVEGDWAFCPDAAFCSVCVSAGWLEQAVSPSPTTKTTVHWQDNFMFTLPMLPAF